MRTPTLLLRSIMSGLLIPFLFLASTPAAEERLRYSCSAQVYEAFEKERLDVFTKETNIPVELFVSSSASSINRLMFGHSDVASTARGIFYPLKESGYFETPFCRDPLAVIAHSSCTLNGITEEQMVQIFSGTIENWRDLGGPNERIVVVIPAKDTAAFENFERLSMKRREFKYDLTAHKSTMVIDVVKRFPSAISFISFGAIAGVEGVKILKINGLGPRDREYPYFQEFYFVTKGRPAGTIKTFIDFALSEKGRAIMDKRGMIPIKR